MNYIEIVKLMILKKLIVTIYKLLSRNIHNYISYMNIEA